MTKEFANNNIPETTPEKLMDELKRPEIISMLARHFKEYVDTGILHEYRRSLLQEIAPITDDNKDILLKIMSLDDIAKLETRKQNWKPFILHAIKLEAPLLVGMDNSVDIFQDPGDEYTEFSAIRYLLKKFDIASGEFSPHSWVEVGATFSYVANPLMYGNFTAEQLSIVKRHYQEQVDNGIIIS